MKTFLASLQHIGLLTVALFVALLANFAYGAWNNPTSAPTGNNAPAPINVSSAEQNKAGNLNLNNNLRVGNNLSVENTLEVDDNFTLGGRIASGDYASVGNYLAVSGNTPTIYLNDSNASSNGSFRYNGNNFRYEFYRTGVTGAIMEVAGGFTRVSDQIRANEFCDRDGNNCFNHNDLNVSTGSTIPTNDEGDIIIDRYCDPTDRDCLNFYRINGGATRVVEVNHRATNDASSRQASMQIVVQNSDRDGSDGNNYTRFQDAIRANRFCARDGSNCVTPGQLRNVVDNSGASGPRVYSCPEVSRMAACSGQLQLDPTCDGPRENTSDDTNFTNESYSCTEVGRLN